MNKHVNRRKASREQTTRRAKIAEWPNAPTNASNTQPIEQLKTKQQMEGCMIQNL